MSFTPYLRSWVSVSAPSSMQPSTSPDVSRLTAATDNSHAVHPSASAKQGTKRRRSTLRRGRMQIERWSRAVLNDITATPPPGDEELAAYVEATKCSTSGQQGTARHVPTD